MKFLCEPQLNFANYDDKKQLLCDLYTMAFLPTLAEAGTCDDR